MARYAWRTWRDARPAARKWNISVWRIIKEQVALKYRNELRPDEYFRYGLDDPNMPWEEKLTFVGSDFGRKLWYIFTPARYHGYYRNKLAFKHLFRSMGFPVAKFYGVYDPQWGHTADGAPLRNADDIAAWMKTSGVEEAVFKPTESAEGQMIFVMAGRKPDNPQAFISLDGQEYTPERIIEELNDPDRLALAFPDAPVQRTFLVEQRLHPHPEIVEMTSSATLCCLRLVTLVTSRGDIDIIGSYFRLQPSSSGADNSEEEGTALYLSVDPETGRLGEGVLFYGADPTKRYKRHPDGGSVATGRTLPMYKEALDLARKAAQAVPMARTIGWDLAMTPQGVYLVEGNACYGIIGKQTIGRTGLATPAFRETYQYLLDLHKPYM